MEKFEAAIVGGGIIGGAIAFELAQHARRVVLLDRQQPGQEASWAAAGMLRPAPENPDSIPLVPLARASLELYPHFVAQVEEISGRKVGYRPEGALEAIFTGDAERELSTLIALHHGLGLSAEPLRLEDARELEPALSPEARAVALMPNEAAVDPRALTSALLDAAARLGAEIRGGTPVTSLIEDAGRVTGVVAGSKKIFAENVVIAAGCWSGQLAGVGTLAPTRPVRGQMVALRSAKAHLTRVVRSARGYLVPRDDLRPQKIVAGSTVEHVGFEKGLTAGGIEEILSTVLELVPDLAGAEILETWSGLRPDSPDHLPILGPAETPGLLMATGHHRNGILLAPITAKLIREWLTEQRTSVPWDEFSPLRFGAARHNSARGTSGTRA